MKIILTAPWIERVAARLLGEPKVFRDGEHAIEGNLWRGNLYVWRLS